MSEPDIAQRNNTVHLWTWGIVWALIAAAWIYGPISIWNAWADADRSTKAQVFTTIAALWNMLFIPIGGLAFAFSVTRRR